MRCERTQFSNSTFWRLVFSHSWFRTHLQLDFVSLEMSSEPLVWEHQSLKCFGGEPTIFTLTMTSQYRGDKVSKSSSPDPRKICFLVCHVTISVVFIGWAVGTTARQQCRALVNKYYQLLFLRSMVNGWEKESMTLFEMDRVSGLVLTRSENSIHLERGHGFSYSEVGEGRQQTCLDSSLWCNNNELLIFVKTSTKHHVDLINWYRIIA